ncbi:MAG: hypothetical protein NT016_00815 [Candidatus Aenigmarchaeota archaeon]|nr:hypothetical protein [Candidatus Aenigmarchaeota archaeon]
MDVKHEWTSKLEVERFLFVQLQLDVLVLFQLLQCVLFRKIGPLEES